MMHVFRMDLEFQAVNGRWMRRDLELIASDGQEALEVLDEFFGARDRYRLKGFVRLAERPRVLIGVTG